MILCIVIAVRHQRDSHIVWSAGRQLCGIWLIPLYGATWVDIIIQDANISDVMGSDIPNEFLPDEYFIGKSVSHSKLGAVELQNHATVTEGLYCLVFNWRGKIFLKAGLLVQCMLMESIHQYEFDKYCIIQYSKCIFILQKWVWYWLSGWVNCQSIKYLSDSNRYSYHLLVGCLWKYLKSFVILPEDHFHCSVNQQHLKWFICREPQLIPGRERERWHLAHCKKQHFVFHLIIKFGGNSSRPSMPALPLCRVRRRQLPRGRRCDRSRCGPCA